MLLSITGKLETIELDNLMATSIPLVTRKSEIIRSYEKGCKVADQQYTELHIWCKVDNRSACLQGRATLVRQFPWAKPELTLHKVLGNLTFRDQNFQKQECTETEGLPAALVRSLEESGGRSADRGLQERGYCWQAQVSTEHRPSGLGICHRSAGLQKPGLLLICLLLDACSEAVDWPVSRSRAMGVRQ